MQAETGVVRIEKNGFLYPDLAALKAWVKQSVTRELVLDVVVVGSAVTVLGAVLLALSSAFQNSTVIGSCYF